MRFPGMRKSSTASSAPLALLAAVFFSSGALFAQAPAQTPAPAPSPTPAPAHPASAQAPAAPAAQPGAPAAPAPETATGPIVNQEQMESAFDDFYKVGLDLEKPLAIHGLTIRRDTMELT